MEVILNLVGRHAVAVVSDLDETVEKLTVALPGRNLADLRRALGDRSRR